MKTLFLFFFLLIIYQMESQNTFFNIYKTSFFEQAYTAIETQNGDFIIAGELASDGYYYDVKGLLLRIDFEGNLIQEETFADTTNNEHFFIIKVYPNDPGKYLLIGNIDSIVNDNYYSKLLLLKTDDSFSILSQKTFPSEINHIFRPQMGDIVYDSILYIASAIHIINGHQQVSITKIKLPYDSIGTYLTSGNSHIVTDILYLYDQDVINVTYFGPLVRNNSALKFLRLDKDLNFISSQYSPDYLMSTACMTHFSDTSFILTATKRRAGDSATINSFIMNSNNEPVQAVEIYGNCRDTLLYAGAGTNTAINGSSIFITGAYNFDPSTFPWQTTPTWIQIARVDTGMNLISQHYFGGDAEYFPYSIIATSDGGAFITGFTWDYTIPGNEQWDVFALKVDTAGTITNIPENASWQACEAILCPNPGHDYVNSVLAFQYKTARLKIYDLHGRIVLNREIYANNEKIDVSSLTEGTYLYEFFSGTKRIGWGKWIKL